MAPHPAGGILPCMTVSARPPSLGPVPAVQSLVWNAWYMWTELLHTSAPPALCSRAQHPPWPAHRTALRLTDCLLLPQVVNLGEPVTSLSLSPGMEMLATTHTGLRGIYLWSNRQAFGGGDDVVHSDAVVRAQLPTISAREGETLAAQQQKGLH